MAGKIFVNYRRDDEPSAAARVRDGLAAKFGRSNVFFDVDDLLAGQRFDEDLVKALAACEVFVAILGPRWVELLKARAATGERDCEEIAAALRRKIVVIPVRVGREGQLAPLPRADDLPEDIGDLVLYQKHDVAHERFGRDIAELHEAITIVRRTKRPQLGAPRARLSWIGATVVMTLAVGYVGAHYAGVPVPWPRSAEADARAKSAQDAKVRAEAEEARRQTALAAEAEARRQRGAEEARRQAALERERSAEEARRQAALRAAEEEEAGRQRAEEAARRQAAQEEARRQPKSGRRPPSSQQAPAAQGKDKEMIGIGN